MGAKKLPSKLQIRRDKARDKYLKKTYGISLAKYNSILEEQDGKCFICQRTPKQIRKKRALAVDHCHDTGRIRGLLCHNCNMNIISLVEKRPYMAENIKIYLTREVEYGCIP